jgi:hypothetical protein
MDLKFLNRKVLTFQFERLSPKKKLKDGQTISVTIAVTIKNKSISKINDTSAKVISEFILDEKDFGKFNLDIQTDISSDEIDDIISHLENDPKKQLPKEISNNFANNLFLFCMPLIIPVAEKAKIPVPLPGLQNLDETSKKKPSKP